MNKRIQEIEQQIEALVQELFAERAKAEPEPVCDFSFISKDGPVTLSELFGDKTELIVSHNMGDFCSYCTLWADCLEGSRKRLETRCALVMVTSDPPEVFVKNAQARGWTFNIVCDDSREFTQRMGFWDEQDGWGPGTSTFRKNPDGSILRTGWTTYGPGDAFCPPWHYFSLLGIFEDDWNPGENASC